MNKRKEAYKNTYTYTEIDGVWYITKKFPMWRLPYPCQKKFYDFEGNETDQAIISKDPADGAEYVRMFLKNKEAEDTKPKLDVVTREVQPRRRTIAGTPTHTPDTPPFKTPESMSTEGSPGASQVHKGQAFHFSAPYNGRSAYVQQQQQQGYPAGPTTAGFAVPGSVYYPVSVPATQSPQQQQQLNHPQQQLHYPQPQFPHPLQPPQYVHGSHQQQAPPPASHFPTEPLGNNGDGQGGVHPHPPLNAGPRPSS